MITAKIEGFGYDPTAVARQWAPKVTTTPEASPGGVTPKLYVSMNRTSLPGIKQLVGDSMVKPNSVTGDANQQVLDGTGLGTQADAPTGDEDPGAPTVEGQTTASQAGDLIDDLNKAGGSMSGLGPELTADIVPQPETGGFWAKYKWPVVGLSTLAVGLTVLGVYLKMRKPRRK